jgi:hypothetical protein
MPYLQGKKCLKRAIRILQGSLRWANALETLAALCIALRELAALDNER